MADEGFITDHSPVELRAPILVAAFRGWNDAGDAATFAATHLARVWSAKKIAAIDPEEFYDFTAVRPTVSLSEGLSRTVEWPENSVHAARIEGAERDLILLQGIELSLRWKGF